MRRAKPGGRLGDLPADLQTHHGRQLTPANLPPPPATPGADARRFPQPMPPGAQAFIATGARVFPWSFQTIVGSKQYLNANDHRRYLLVQNNTGADLWMNLDAHADVGLGIKIVTGGSGEWYYFSLYNALYFWAAADGGSFSVWEG
jgi:hypothetical protein